MDVYHCLSPTTPHLPCYQWEESMEYKSKGKTTLVLGPKRCHLLAGRNKDNLKEAEKAEPPIFSPVKSGKWVEVAVLWALKLVPLLITFFQSERSAGRASIDRAGLLRAFFPSVLDILHISSRIICSLQIQNSQCSWALCIIKN